MEERIEAPLHGRYFEPLPAGIEQLGDGSRPTSNGAGSSRSEDQTES